MKKRDVPVPWWKRVRWGVWAIAISVIAGIGTIALNARELYHWWAGAPPTPSSSVISIAPKITITAPVPLAPAAELVASCQTIRGRWSLEALVMREIEKREARFTERLEAMQQDLNMALPPARRRTFTPWPSDRNLIDLFHNGWLVNGYVTCTITNKGNKLATDVTLTIPRGHFTVYDGQKLSEPGVQEVHLGDLRPEISRAIEVFSESPGDADPTESDLKFSHAEGKARLSFAR